MMKLRKYARKVFGTGVHREVTPLQTLERLWPHLARIGITRIADITGLDRIGIPVYNAIIPRSRDILSVYNGKGLTALDAKTGAMMEAIERYAAAIPRPPAAVGRYVDLAPVRPTLNPYDFNLELQEGYTNETRISWLEGFDLLNEESVLVPMFLAGYYVFDLQENTCFRLTTSNGLASGNTLEEAICHALCEIIERDAWTLADMMSHRFSRALASEEDGLGYPAVAAWFQELHPSIELASLREEAQYLLARFEQAGLKPLLKNITSDTGIPSIFCTVAEQIFPSFSHAHFGVGTHPDANVAVTRAITELAQSRVVDIQGMREDISMPDQTVDKSLLHVKRTSKINRESWYHKGSSKPVQLAAIQSYQSEDLMEDIRLMLGQLRNVGIRRVIVVDLSPPDIEASVVRIIAPGLESWAIDKSKIGSRATAAWNVAATLLQAARENVATGTERR